MDATLHIDYLSVSTKAAAWSPPTDFEYDIHGYYRHAALIALSMYPSFVHNSMKGVRDVGNGGSGYKHRTHFSEFGWTIFYGSSHGGLQIALPGQACHALRMDTDSEGESVGLNPLLTSSFNKVTRLDIAATFRDGCEPLWLAAHFRNKDVHKMSQINSETGRTVYIGAPTSEVHCRVYRYAPPHPRHEWIRIEFVLKGNHALRAQQRIPDIGLEPIMKGLLDSWGFSADEYVNAIIKSGESERIAYESRQKAGSLRWLFGVAIPSLKTALDTGIITRADVQRLLGLESLE